MIVAQRPVLDLKFIKLDKGRLCLDIEDCGEVLFVSTPFHTWRSVKETELLIRKRIENGDRSDFIIVPLLGRKNRYKARFLTPKGRLIGETVIKGSYEGVEQLIKKLYTNNINTLLHGDLERFHKVTK